MQLVEINATQPLHFRQAKRTFLETHHLAMAKAKDLKANYRELFEILLIVESEQIYYQFEVTSLYLYCTELLELSPSIANDFINVTRKSIEVPQLAEAIRSSGLTISKARKICSVLNSENCKEWIELATSCSTRIIEKAVAQANPRESVHESMKYVSSEILEFKLAVTEEWRELLAQTKDLMSQKKRHAVSSEEALLALMKQFVAKKDPVVQAMRVIDKTNEKANLRATAKIVSLSKISEIVAAGKLDTKPEIKAKTRYRNRSVEHQVNLRDLNQCVYVDQRGKRCDSKRWLEKHHIVEFAEGGEHTLENLETLCSAHHKIRHKLVT